MNRAAKFNVVVSIVLTSAMACGESDHSDVTSPSAGSAGRGGSEDVGAGNGSGGSNAGAADQSPGGEPAAGGVLSGGAGGSGGKGGSAQGGAGKAGNSTGGGFACTLTDPDVCVCETGKTNGSATSCPASDCCVQTSNGCACKQPDSTFTCNDVKNYVSGAVIIPSCPP